MQNLIHFAQFCIILYNYALFYTVKQNEITLANEALNELNTKFNRKLDEISDLNNQYDEYQKQSLELEHELETQLKQTEERIKYYENKNNRLHNDNETLKNRLNEVNTSTHRQISQLQEDLAKSNAVKEEMHKYIRELEQKMMI